MQQDTPSQVRIRTGNGNEHRYKAIERASDFYGCNKTKAVVSACEDVPEMVKAARDVIRRDDLTQKQRREISDTLSTKAVSFNIEDNIEVERDP
jgi:hypothetical protein